MRQRLIGALTYPRLLVQRIIDGRECPHDSLFQATSAHCRQCNVNSECHWVNCLDEFSGFADKPEHTINASLRYGVRLVESLHSELHHDETLCTCEACSWVRDAQRLIEEFEENLLPNPYRPAY
ncbi:MAG: hypothetical protein GTO71_02420 [Woeseiaceae bacterium]|nr:hypothetical protein [Woeseiaceae bacterium]NIP19965.1 hypothetical protein [Woeseiaceae bacterium]NIS88761.1 hypothetical protein [Woeseiaceae bacterium]